MIAMWDWRKYDYRLGTRGLWFIFHGFVFHNFLGSFRNFAFLCVGFLPRIAAGGGGEVRRGGGRGGQGLQLEQVVEGAVELAVKGGFVAQEKLGRAGGFGGAAEGEEGSDGGGADGGVAERDVTVDRRLLGAPDAQLAPAGDDHGLDERHLSLRGRLIFVHEGGEEVEEAALVLAFQDDGGGEQLVTRAVGGGAALAFGRGGAAGEGSVGAGGSDLVFGAGAGGGGRLRGVGGLGFHYDHLLVDSRGCGGVGAGSVYGKALRMGKI
jgi:hypothetical protein